MEWAGRSIAAGSESHRAISRLRQRDQGGKAAFPSPQLKALLATARHLCLKSHKSVIVPGVTLEMSVASWQGFKESTACLWWSPNILLFTNI